MKSISSFTCRAAMGIGIVLAGFTAAHAQVAGRYAAPILRTSPYAHQVAMGEAFTALAYNVNAMRYNVGGLGNVRNILASIHLHQWIDDTYQGAAEGAFPTRFGVIGVGLSYFNEGDIIEVDENFFQTGNVLSSNDAVFTLGYGNHFNLFNNRFALGLAAKGVHQGLVGVSGNAAGLDLGVLYTFTDETKEATALSLGATLQNFTLKKLRVSGGSEYPLPETIRGGLALRQPFAQQHLISVGIDASKFLASDDKEVRLQAGTELLISKVFAVRGGYKFHDQELSRWGAGFGVIFPMGWLGGSSTAFDYAFSPMDEFDTQTHRFSLAFSFGQVVQSDVLMAQQELDAARRARQEAEEARLAALEAEARIRDLEERLQRALDIVKGMGDTLRITPQPGGNVLVTMRINFNFDKSDIRPDMYVTLNKVAEVLNTYQGSQVWVSGHTDYFGTDEYNFHLAGRRMNSVMSYLSGRGISSGRFVDPTAYGEWRPLVPNTSAENHFLNRRVEFLIYTGNNRPGIHPGSLIRDVEVRGDTIAVVGNGALEYTQQVLDNPPRLVLKFPKVYIPDPKTIAINRGKIRQARLGFHPEDGSTWVVLDLDEAMTLPTNIAGKRVNIVASERIAGNKPQ